VEKQIDYDGDKPHTTAFDQAGMSVFVEGPGFPALDLSLILSRKPEWVAIATFSAAEIIDKPSEFGFELLHDPYEDENGNQHDNHAIVICKKNVTKGMKMKLASQWGLKPPAK